MTTETQKYQNVLIEYPADHVARVSLNRPKQRNAQNTELLYELNLAFNDGISMHRRRPPRATTSTAGLRWVMWVGWTRRAISTSPTARAT